MNNGSSDEELMRAIRGGSRDAFRELMGRWQRPVYQFLRLMGVDPSEAEDGVQEVFLRVFSYRKRYRSLGSGFRAFLFRVSRNVAIDFLRKSGTRARVGPLEAEPAAESGESAWNDRFDCAWALDQLSDRHRAVVILNVFAGLDYRETAATLGIPVGTVKSRMHYALARLREAFHAESSR